MCQYLKFNKTHLIFSLLLIRLVDLVIQQRYNIEKQGKQYEKEQ